MQQAIRVTRPGVSIMRRLTTIDDERLVLAARLEILDDKRATLARLRDQIDVTLADQSSAQHMRRIRND